MSNIKLILFNNMKIGLEAAKNVPIVIGKLVAAVSGSILAPTINHTVKTLTKTTAPWINKDKDLRYISESVNPDHLNINDLSMNLLIDLNTYNYLSGVFLFIILNTYLAIVLTEVDIDRYLDPNTKNKLLRLIRLLVLRNMKIWSKSSHFLFLFAWSCLLICLIMSKVCLYFILN